MRKFLTTFRKRAFIAVLGIVLVLIAAIFAESKQQKKVCKNITVQLNNTSEHPFVTEKELLKLISPEETSTPIVGSRTERISIQKIKETLHHNPFIVNADVYKNWKGNLTVKASVKNPIARLYFTDGSSQYIDETGTSLPLAKNHTAYVPIITGKDFNKIEKVVNGKTYQEAFLKLLLFIRQDTFWKAQIASLHIQNNGDIVMLTQIGKQEVIFGKPRNIRQKFSKLKLFYKKILPYKGWNTYKRVNVKFNQQIVCE